MSELNPIKEKNDQQVKSGLVVRMKKVEYATSFGRQVYFDVKYIDNFLSASKL